MKKTSKFILLGRPAAHALRSTTLVAIVSLVGCASAPESIVQGPTMVPPVPQPTYVERRNTGAIFSPDSPATTLFSGQRLPRFVGDTLKIDIAEELSASSKLSTDTSRENKMASKGPGLSSDSNLGLLKTLFNMDASASGSDSFKGSGSTENANKFNGKIAVSVINVLANGNLVVAGERSIGLNGGVTTLRFSGIVNPTDVKSGNIVSSADVVNAKLEAAGRGDVSDSASRSWLQRVLTKSMTVW